MIQFDTPKKRQARIEIIPMIDVMMFLLVFFVLISINVIPSLGLPTHLPSSGAAAHVADDKPIILTITKAGQIQVNGDNAELATLATRVRAVAQGNKEALVIIKSDADTVMQQVIDVMDTLRQGGFAKVSIATRARAQG